MNAIIVTVLWMAFSGAAALFISTELVHATRDYQYQKRMNGDTADAARLLAQKAACLTVATVLFFAAGLLSLLLPQATPPPTFTYRGVLIQSLLILAQGFVFLDGFLLFILRRMAKRRFLARIHEQEKLELTRDELTEEIRANRRIFAELGKTVVARLDAIQRKLDE